MNDQISRQKLIEELEDLPKCFYKDYKGAYIALKGVIRIIASQPPADQWIPCSERLPEEEGYYIVTYNLEGYKVIDRTFFSETYGAFMRYGQAVTAWMPLPEPYKGVE